MHFNMQHRDLIEFCTNFSLALTRGSQSVRKATTWAETLNIKFPQ